MFTLEGDLVAWMKQDALFRTQIHQVPWFMYNNKRVEVISFLIY